MSAIVDAVSELERAIASIEAAREHTRKLDRTEFEATRIGQRAREARRAVRQLRYAIERLGEPRPDGDLGSAAVSTGHRGTPGDLEVA